MAVVEVAHPAYPGQNIMTGSLAVVDNTLTLTRFMTWGVVSFQLTGTWTGTVTFECTVDGTTWVALQVFPSTSATGATTATVNGAWAITSNPWAGVRCRFSTATSGTVVVTIKNAPSQF